MAPEKGKYVPFDAMPPATNSKYQRTHKRSGKQRSNKYKVILNHLINMPICPMIIKLYFEDVQHEEGQSGLSMTLSKSAIEEISVVNERHHCLKVPDIHCICCMVDIWVWVGLILLL